MALEHETWRSIAAALGVQAISPFNMTISGTSVTFTALLPQFGRSAGMIVDPNWSVIEPHVDGLIRDGYGFSCISIAGSIPHDMQDVLADWGWNGPDEAKPPWLTS